MRIAIALNGLNYGGIERISIDYMKLLLKEGHSIDLYLLNPKEKNMIGEVPKEVTIYDRPFHNFFLIPEAYWRMAIRFWWGKYLFPIIYAFLRFILFFYKFIWGPRKKYNLAIAFAGHLNDLSFVAYDFVKATKKCCWLHGGLYQYMVTIPGYQILYQRIKNLVALTDLCQDECFFFNKYLHLNIRKMYNPSFIASRVVDNAIAEEIKRKYGDFILMVARLTPQKDHIGLVKAMEYLDKKYNFHYNVVFVGDGPKRDEVESYVASSNISNHIFFAGKQANPQNYYAAAKMFALSSISEGLPTVLVEASYFGLPLVSSDSSVKEILGRNEYGLISSIYDYEKLGENIYTILSNEVEYTKYSKLSKSRFKDFTPEVINNQLIEMINNLE